MIRALPTLRNILVVGVVPALVVVAATSTAWSRTWIASADGANGDGTVETVLPQMQSADSLRLLPGAHVWPLPASPPAMTLVGDPGSSVVGYGAEFRDVAFVTISGVVFENLSARVSFIGVGVVVVGNVVYRGCKAGMWATMTDSLEIVDTLFADSGRASGSAAGGLQVGHGDVRITGCEFIRNVSSAGVPYDEFESGGGALRLGREITSAVVSNCVFDGNEAGSGSAVHSLAKRILFERNTVVRNSCQSGAVVIHAAGLGPEDTVVRQSVFAENAAFGLWFGDSGPGTPQLYCNAFWENNLVARIGDFYEREDRQWRAVQVVGYEGAANHFTSTLADPMFCDSLVVHAESELATQEFPCEPIGGAHEIGCTLNPTKATSWGQLKDLFGK